MQEAECPPRLLLCCHVFKKRQRQKDGAPAAGTRLSTHAGDGEAFRFITCTSPEVFLQETLLQSAQQGVAAELPAGDIDDDGHMIYVGFENWSLEKQPDRESADVTEEGNSEEHQEPSLSLSPTRGTHSTVSSPHVVLCREDNITLAGSQSISHLDKHGKEFQKSFRNFPETGIVNDDHSTGGTARHLVRHKNKVLHVDGFHRGTYSLESEVLVNVRHITRVKIPSVRNTLIDHKQDDKTVGVQEGGDDLMPSKNMFYLPARKARSVGHLRVLEGRLPPSVRDGRTEDADESRPADEHQPDDSQRDAEKHHSPLVSSLLFKKGVTFSIFFWAYLATFMFAASYILSPLLSPFPTLDVTVKIMLVQHFPSIIQLEVFRAVDYIMTFIYNTFT